MSKVYVLVGGIASGKSTWVKERGLPSVSKDEQRYLVWGGDYIFEPLVEPFISDIVEAQMRALLAAGTDFCVDGCHMNPRARALVLRTCHGNDIVAVVFKDRGKKSHVDARMAHNARGYTRERWEAVYTGMKSAYRAPTLAEGFTHIIGINREDTE